jgi:hypothetical protein
MFTLSITDNKVFIREDDGEIQEGKECCLQYTSGGCLNFIESGGRYAYSEFFIEGQWPDEYYGDDNDDFEEKYDGIKLKMIRGNWYSMKDLIDVVNSEEMYDIRHGSCTPIFSKIEDPEFEEKLSKAFLSITNNPSQYNYRDFYKIIFL